MLQSWNLKHSHDEHGRALWLAEPVPGTLTTWNFSYIYKDAHRWLHVQLPTGLHAHVSRAETVGLLGGTAHARRAAVLGLCRCSC